MPQAGGRGRPDELNAVCIHDGQVLLADRRLVVSRWNLVTGKSLPLVDFSADEIGVDCALSLSPTRFLLGRRDGTHCSSGRSAERLCGPHADRQWHDDLRLPKCRARHGGCAA
jgi:hypothetical protein